MKSTFGAVIGVFAAALFTLPQGAGAQAGYGSYDPYASYSYSYDSGYYGGYSYDPYAYQQQYQYVQPYQYQPQYSYPQYQQVSYPSYQYQSYPSSYAYTGSAYGGSYSTPFSPYSNPISAPLTYNGPISQASTNYMINPLNPYNDQPYGGYGITRSYPWGDWTRCYWGSDYGYNSCNYNPSQPLFDPYTGSWY